MPQKEHPFYTKDKGNFPDNFGPESGEIGGGVSPAVIGSCDGGSTSKVKTTIEGGGEHDGIVMGGSTKSASHKTTASERDGVNKLPKSTHMKL